MSHVLSVRISDDEMHQLDWYAEQCGITRSQALREVLKKTPRIVLSNLRLDFDRQALNGWEIAG